MSGMRWICEVGAGAVLLLGCVQALAADPQDSGLPKGPSITVTNGEPSPARNQRTVVVGECHRRLYSVAVSDLGRGEGYISLEINHKTIRKYSAEPFVHDVLRQKQIVRLFLECGPTDDHSVQVHAFGISFEKPEQPEYFMTVFGLNDSGKWVYPAGIVPVTYEHWLRNLG